MESLPNSESELISEMTFQEVEYVLHIGIEDMYGLYAEGLVQSDESDVTVLGSVMLDEKSGDPIKESGTSFHAYPNGISKEKIEVVSGQSAISAMKNICGRKNIDDPFIPRSESDVDV